MTGLVVVGAALLCLQSLFCAAQFDFSLSASKTSESERNDTQIDTDEAQANADWSCPNGWTPYVSEEQISCIWFGNESLTHEAARDRCKALEGELVSLHHKTKSENITAKAIEVEGEYWIGLSKGFGYDTLFIWHSITGLIYPTQESLPSQIKDYLSYKPKCVFISSYSEEWDMDDCSSEYNFICERDKVCAPGKFGTRCERECHCAGEPCAPTSPNSPDTVTCKWGCERDWMGPACDKRKKYPEVKYFCINSAEERYVHVRIYTFGAEYSAVRGLTSEQEVGEWCGDTQVHREEEPDAPISVIFRINNATIEEMNRGECVGEQVNNDTFIWTLAIKENDDILLDHDLQVHITCDFSMAEHLMRTNEYIIGGEPAHVHQENIQPESLSADVLLRVVSADSWKSVTAARMGSSVVLQMNFALQAGSLLKGIFPYNCYAMSPDGQHRKQLTDELGCSVYDSPVKPFQVAGEHTVQTPWFKLFAFEDQTSVVFQCSFKLCFKSKCEVGCLDHEFIGGRRKRDTSDREPHRPRHSTTRTIRVLPSIQAQGQSETKPVSTGENINVQVRRPQDPMPSEHQLGPLVYLNPVTCTIFLLLLVIFLGMYISFLRALRKSVNDIRREIEVRRSRDKFLTCGCVQQKDRDFVSP